MANVFVKTLSLKSTINIVSKKFKVNEAALRVDWNRKDTWPTKVLDKVSSPVLRDFYLLAVHRTLRQIERELTQNTNPSARTGLLKCKAEILFKLIQIQQSFVEQDVVKRIEKMEKKLEVLESEK